jgi:hypothetical protein
MFVFSLQSWEECKGGLGTMTYACALHCVQHSRDCQLECDWRWCSARSRGQPTFGSAVGRNPGALEFSFEIAATDTLHAEPVLVIDERPVEIYCAPCNAELEWRNIQDFGSSPLYSQRRYTAGALTGDQID